MNRTSPLEFPPLPSRDAAEYELLLACLRARFSGVEGSRIKALVSSVDAERFAAVVDRHRLAGIVNAVLREAGVQSGVVADVVAASAGGVAIRGLRQAQALAHVLDLLQSEDVEPLALKGPVMSQTLYGDVGMRPSGDLDLLMQQQDLRKARGVLLQAGFAADPPLSDAGADAYFKAGFAYSFHDEGQEVEVELHPSLAHRAFAFAPDMAGVWSRAERADVAGRSVLRLSPEDRILFLCVHGAKHEWDQLIWVCDVAEALRVAPDIDWRAVSQRATHTGSLRMLQLGVHLAHAFTGVALPVASAVLAAHPSLRALAILAWRRMLDPIDARPGLWRQLRFHVAVRERPAERRAQVREKVTDAMRSLMQSARVWVTPSDTDRAFVALPRGLNALYFVVRPLRVMLRSLPHAVAEAVPHREGSELTPIRGRE